MTGVIAPQPKVFDLLIEVAIKPKQQLIRNQILEIISVLADKQQAQTIIQAVIKTDTTVLDNVLNDWQEKGEVPPEIYDYFSQFSTKIKNESQANLNQVDLINVLKNLAQDPNPIISTGAVHSLLVVDQKVAIEQVNNLYQNLEHWLMKETKEYFNDLDNQLILPTIDKILLLWQTSLFASICPSYLVKLARNAKKRIYHQEEIICQIDNSSDELFVLIEGELRVEIPQQKGTAIVGKIYPGETVGEMGVLSHKPRSATVIANQPTNTVLIIETEDFDYILSTQPEITQFLLNTMIERVQSVNKSIMGMEN